MSSVVPVQLVVNIVAVVTAAVGAVALQESPLTAVQMVCRPRLALQPITVLDPVWYAHVEAMHTFQAALLRRKVETMSHDLASPWGMHKIAAPAELGGSGVVMSRACVAAVGEPDHG